MPWPSESSWEQIVHGICNARLVSTVITRCGSALLDTGLGLQGEMALGTARPILIFGLARPSWTNKCAVGASEHGQPLGRFLLSSTATAAWQSLLAYPRESVAHHHKTRVGRHCGEVSYILRPSHVLCSSSDANAMQSCMTRLVYACALFVLCVRMYGWMG